MYTSLILLNTFINAQKISYDSLRKQAMEESAKLRAENEEMKSYETPIEESTEKYNRDPVSPALVPRFFCDNTFRLNSVRDEVMNNSNYNKLMYRHKIFLLYVSASWCDYCCQQEKELLFVNQFLQDKMVDGEEIPIIQLNSDTDIDPLKDLKVGFFKVPTLYFVKDKQFYQYNSFWRAHNIIKFINNIINPIVELHSIEDVEAFFDTETNFVEKNDFLGNTILDIPEQTDFHFRNRIIGFFSDVEDYSAEYSLFSSLAEKISHRSDLRVGIITDKEIVRHFKQTYEGIWFNSHSWNSIVLKRIDKYYFLDLSLLPEHLEIFMVYNSIPHLDELSNNNNVFIQKIATPIALFFIDTTFIAQNFHSYLKFLVNISERYTGKYVFMFIDGNTKTKAKEQLGLKKESPLPTLVLNYFRSNKQKQFPFDKTFNDIEIMKFLDESATNKLGGNDLDVLREKISKSFSDKIVRNLKLATKLERTNMDKIIHNKKYDVVVFVVDTDYDDVSEKLAKYINKICLRFKILGIKSVLFTTYDLNESGLITFEGINYEKGSIMIYPSNSKKPIKFMDKLTVLRLMKFVEKSVETKIRLPDIPHIDLELQEDYYTRKSVLENYDENINKTDFEIDDMLNMDFEIVQHDDEKKVEL